MFQLLRITDFVHTLVYTEDETNHLYNSIDIRCQCMLNQNLNGFGQGALPPAAYGLVVQKLNEVRKPLLVQTESSVGLTTILQSPLPGMETDFRFGPKCSVIRLDPFHGSGNLWIDMEFHTDLGCAGQDYLLSNRYNWTVSHDPGTYAATHQIDGVAHFRLDKLIKDKVTPDELRAKFIMPPPPLNFRRNPPTVGLGPGMDSVEYQIVDVEQMLNGPGLMAFGATNIEIEIGREYNSGLVTNWSDTLSENVILNPSRWGGWFRRQLE